MGQKRWRDGLFPVRGADPSGAFQTMTKVTCVIPCYNEQEVLPLLFDRFTAAAETWGVDWNVICVDDGSSDSTWALLCEQAAKDRRWQSLALARNFGHQTAVSAGIYHADGDVVVVIDADLQDPPEELHRFLDKWREGYQVVYAVRKKRKEGPLKRFCYWAFYRVMAQLVSIPIPLDTGDFCVMDRKVVDVLNAMPERNRFVRGLRAWAGFKQVGLEYERHARAAGDVKYTFRKLLKLAFDGIFSFSVVPLTFATWLGFGVSLLALAGILFTFVQRLFPDLFNSVGLRPVPGYATIVIAILFLGGVQLTCLGILGEYLGRIFDEVKRRPQWVFRDNVGLQGRIPPP
jgi:dolichol-phosphate mannosyltransferase